MQDEPRLEIIITALNRLRKNVSYLASKWRKIIADAGDAMVHLLIPSNVLTNSDMEYGYVQDEDGEMVQWSDGLYSL